MEIRTDNQFRNLIYGYELTDAERKDFDYIDAEEINARDFFRYRGRVYDTSEFCQIPDGVEELRGWHGYHPDTFLSGVVIRYSSDYEMVKVGRYIS